MHKIFVLIFCIFILNFFIYLKFGLCNEDVTNNSATVTQPASGEFFYSDPFIVYTARKTLYENMYIGRFDFSVTSENGIVELCGEVDTQKSLQLAESVLTQISGVKKVNNKLVINPALLHKPSMIGDKTINDEITILLTTNKRVKIYRLNSNTVGSRVTITGIVDSLEGELIALELARNVKGVESVRSKIQIDSGVNDGFILFTTKLALISDARINGFGIKVNVEDGVIILRGTVDDEKTREIAINKARGISGSKGVISYLEVGQKIVLQDQLVKDNLIISQINEVFKSDPDLSRYDITVMCNEGIVILSGTVDRRDIVLAAVEKASSISGVRAVRSELNIK